MERASGGDLELDEIWLPPGQSLRVPALLGALALFTLWTMWLARPGHSALAVPVGATFALATSTCLLRGLGCFEPTRTPRYICASAAFGKALLGLSAAGAGLVGALRLAVAGVLPFPRLSNALLVTAAALATLFASAQVLVALGVSPRPKRRWSKSALGLLTLGVLLYVPLLGSFSLIDPWETHYGEVAREMLARDDWLSFWWAHERWFFSKPALDFWLQGLSFSLFGVDYQPDGMLGGAALGRTPGPEWAARFPIVVLALIATYLCYHAVARHAGRRSAWISGVVLLTAPYWFLLSRNGMTDMPYAAPLTSALALLALGFATPRERLQAEFVLEFKHARWALSARNLLLVLVLATSLPVLAYLASRNLLWSAGGAGFYFRVRGDIVNFGSGGHNCGLPGNEACAQYSPRYPFFQPLLATFMWLLPLGLFLFANRGENRLRRLYFLAAWYFTALAALGKGAPGLVLPVVIALISVLASGRLRRLLELELVGLVLLVSCLTLPWYVQVFARHGAEFTDRLLFYDMYQRAFEHVHDTNAGEDISFRYYIWQLGYGLFPWTGLAFTALLTWRSVLRAPRLLPARLAEYWGLAALLTFCVFSASLTKFHHYILPAVPGICLVSGVVLARAVPGSRERLSEWGLSGAAAVCALLGAWLLSLGARQDAEFRVWRVVLGLALVVVAGALSFWAGRRHDGAGAHALSPDGSVVGHGSAAYNFGSAVFGLSALFGAGWLGLITWDLSNPGSVPGESRLLHLFSYNYSRPFPAQLEFSAEFSSFGWVFAIFCGLLLLPSLRSTVTRSLLVVACGFCVFALDVYMLRVAPHHGQRNTILTYYRQRSSPNELLVAYQLNWKGENFYTGNRLAIFTSTGQRFTSFLNARRDQGQRVLFVTSEHTRLSSLQTELGHVKSFRLLTTRAENDTFFLARVEL